MCYNNIIDKCRRQKLCKRAQKISAAAPLRVMASRITLASKRAFRVLLLELTSRYFTCRERDISHVQFNTLIDVSLFHVQGT